MLEKTVHPSPKEDRCWSSSKAIEMHSSQQEIWNIERLLVVDTVKDNQIFQPYNATTVVTLVQLVGEEPVNVTV